MATPIATEYSTDTLLGMYNQYHAMLGKNLNTYYPKTTLNYKYNCYAPVAKSDGTYTNVPTSAPAIAYFGVGIRGFYNITADDEISPLSQPYRPKATEQDLYKPIPIRCVPEAYDLTASERANYRMRTKMTVDGQTYICYWLKKLEFADNIQVVQINSSGSESDYDIGDNAADGSALTPTPTAPTTPDVVSGSSKIVVAAEVTCEISGEEILEAINVIYHGDLRRAKISEWGIYSGVDATASYLDVDGASHDYTEAMYVQLAAKRCTTGVDMSNSASVQSEVLTIQNGNLLLLD